MGDIAYNLTAASASHQTKALTCFLICFLPFCDIAVLRAPFIYRTPTVCINIRV